MSNTRNTAVQAASEHAEPSKAFFETLGNNKRWRIIRLLEREPANMSSIARELNIEQTLVSHHLRRLESCGFVFVERRGKERVYRLNTETVAPLLKLVSHHIDRYCTDRCHYC